jgi:hypothetical protein
VDDTEGMREAIGIYVVVRDRVNWAVWFPVHPQGEGNDE